MPRRNNRRKAEYHKKAYIRKRDWRAFDAIESMRVKDAPISQSNHRDWANAPIPHRGEVWFADLGEFDNSSVQRGRRPAVIMSIDVSNEKSGTVTVIPMTSKIKKTWYPSHILITDDDMGCLADEAESAASGGQAERNAQPQPAGSRKALIPSIALTEQVRTIDKRRLLSCIGKVTKTKLAEIEHGLAGSLGLV